MSRNRTNSTLHPWLKGTRVHTNAVQRIPFAPKTRRTRDVVSRAGVEGVPIPELQDHLLIAKGYLPKYSGLPLSHFEQSLALSKREVANLRRKGRYWKG